MLLSDFKSFFETLIAESEEPLYPDVAWELGTTEPQSPGPFVQFIASNGTGLDTDWVTDIRGLDIVVAGQQNSYAHAEELAMFVDKHLLGSGGSRSMSGKRLVDLSRFGSAPYNSEQDDADRYRFTASYLYEVDSELNLT